VVFVAAEAPVSDRLAAAFCIGCRRVDAPQLCPEACDEQTVDLVFGEVQDAAITELEDDLRHVQTLRELVLRSVSATPDPGRRGSVGPQGEWEQTHRVLQAEARSVLRQINADSARQVQVGAAEEVIRLTAGHCSVCGWIEAPQPCLGVCIFRAVEMVPAAEYDEVRGECEHARRQLKELRAVIGQLAWVTPRAGEWERTRRALESRARKALANAEARPDGS
jgi:Fe-S-cluster-containing hydrogenase component 2